MHTVEAPRHGCRGGLFMVNLCRKIDKQPLPVLYR
jgi:hypothetical protein